MMVLSTALLLLLMGPAYAQTCPDGYVCLPDDQYAQVYEGLERLAAIEKSHPTVSIDESIVLVTDGLGRVYSNGTGEHALPGRLEWGHMVADLEIRLNVVLRKREPALWGLRFRPKAAIGVIPMTLDLDDPQQMVDGGLSVDFFHLRKWNLNASVGVRSFGADVGFDVFPNAGIMVGPHWTWPSLTTPSMFTPGVSWYFSFGTWPLP